MFLMSFCYAHIRTPQVRLFPRRSVAMFARIDLLLYGKTSGTERGEHLTRVACCLMQLG